MKEEGLSMAREHREANSDFYLAMGRAEHADSTGLAE
jgi:cyclophilin family peptidyl-prolyl cis-trans isomerase